MHDRDFEPGPNTCQACPFPSACTDGGCDVLLSLVSEPLPSLHKGRADLKLHLQAWAAQSLYEAPTPLLSDHGLKRGVLEVKGLCNGLVSDFSAKDIHALCQGGVLSHGAQDPLLSEFNNIG